MRITAPSENSITDIHRRLANRFEESDLNYEGLIHGDGWLKATWDGRVGECKDIFDGLYLEYSRNRREER